MNAKVFLDTNILVYSYSSNEPQKRAIAQQIHINTNGIFSIEGLLIIL